MEACVSKWYCAGYYCCGENHTHLVSSVSPSVHFLTLLVMSLSIELPSMKRLRIDDNNDVEDVFEEPVKKKRPISMEPHPSVMRKISQLLIVFVSSYYVLCNIITP